jgi:hypothetical protein
MMCVTLLLTVAHELATAAAAVAVSLVIPLLSAQ